jgi:hypothetical protein
MNPESFGPAEVLVWIFTSVTVTNTWLKGPLGAAQVGGSLTVKFTIPGWVPLLLLPHPAAKKATINTAMQDAVKTKRYILFSCWLYKMDEASERRFCGASRGQFVERLALRA